jgi:hypothetical protein
LRPAERAPPLRRPGLPLGCGMDFLLLLLILVLFTRILGCSDATPRKIEGMLGVLELQFSISLVLRGRD